MRPGTIMAAMVLALLVALPGVGCADAVTDCAKVQGKAYTAYAASIVLEIGRACGKGSSAAPAAVSEGALGKAAGKFYAAVGKSVDQFGPASCAYTLATLDDPGVGLDVGSQLQTAIGGADLACLVPVQP